MIHSSTLKIILLYFKNFAQNKHFQTLFIVNVSILLMPVNQFSFSCEETLREESRQRKREEPLLTFLGRLEPSPDSKYCSPEIALAFAIEKRLKNQKVKKGPWSGQYQNDLYTILDNKLSHPDIKNSNEEKKKIFNLCKLQIYQMRFLSLESLLSFLPTRHLNIFCGWQISPNFPFFVQKSCAANNTFYYSFKIFPRF